MKNSIQKQLYEYVNENKEQLNKMIKFQNDYEYDYFGV